ncbi:MAG: NAD-dependent protein deacetylase [Spirochaetota bacterium]
MDSKSYGEALAALAGRQLCVLSGAGVSTESGIPDYRGPERRGKPATPIQYRDYVRDPDARQRYWARSAVGYRKVATATPNAGHKALQLLEAQGYLSGVITQNVDGLHQRAGSAHVVELHGSLANVVCLSCGKNEARDSVQERINLLNPNWETIAGDIAPDGDVHLASELTKSFSVPACLRCGGVLKPDVVFFGESVPKARVTEAFRMLAEAEALLVVGSSLTVYSGYRFVDRALKDGQIVVVFNDGPTRADPVIELKVSGRLGSLLPRFAEDLVGRFGSQGDSCVPIERLSQEDLNPHRRSQIP